jgi:hypothetical protein
MTVKEYDKLEDRFGRKRNRFTRYIRMMRRRIPGWGLSYNLPQLPRNYPYGLVNKWIIAGWNKLDEIRRNCYT